MIEIDLGHVDYDPYDSSEWWGPRVVVKAPPKKGYDGKYYYIYLVIGESGGYYIGKRTSGTYLDYRYIGSSPRSLIEDATHKYIIRFCDTPQELAEAEASMIRNHKGRFMRNTAGTGSSYYFRTGSDKYIWHYYDEILACIARTNATQISILNLCEEFSKHALRHIINNNICVPAMRDWCREHPIDRDESILESLATGDFSRKKCKPHTRVRPKGIIRGGKLNEEGTPVWIAVMDKIDQRAYFNHSSIQYLRDKGYRISKISEMTNVPQSTITKVLSTISDETMRKHNAARRKQVDEWIENNPVLFWEYDL